MEEKISVIVPVLNRDSLLVRCLDSIVGQRHRPMQVIIVDNGSTDRSLPVAKEWRDRHNAPDFEVEVLTEVKPGACAARNKGLRYASGEYVVFFDSDDAMRPGLIGKGVAAALSMPDVHIVCWRCDIHLLDGTVRRPPFDTVNAMENHLVHSLLRTQGYMARTELLRKAGGWNEDLPCWNDWELGVRLITQNPRIIGIPESLADIYSQKDSITGEKFSSKAGLWEKSLDTARETLENSWIPLKRHFLRIVAYRKIVLAAQYAREGRRDLALQLRSDALSSEYVSKGLDDYGIPLLSRGHKMLLRLAYHYVKAGGRGAWRAVSVFDF